MNKIKKHLPVLVFVFLIFGLAGGGLFAEEKTYSAVEKRELQTRPRAKIKTIKNGKFQKKYETYLSDQFPGRDSWVQLQTSVLRLLGKKESNGVYFGKDHYLLERYDASDFDEEQMQANFDALAGFAADAKKTADVHVMMVPTKTWVMQKKLPAFAPCYDEQIFYDTLRETMGELADEVLIPLDDLLMRRSAEGEQIYYRTDHHWTTQGAWYGYEAYVNTVGGDLNRAREKREFQLVCSDFYGTTYAKVNQAPQADEIWIYEPQKPLRVVYNMGEKETDSLYEPEYLETADQYRVFSGGNQAVLEITGGEKNKKTLLLIKDSFANCMIPFLAEDFERLIVVDLRQLNVSCSALIEMFAPTDVLILYNSAQFAQDIEFKIKCM